MLRGVLADLPSRANWSTRYDELVAYHATHGTCCVPKADGALGRWVARQRELAKKNALADDRRAKLDALDFVWNTNDEAWDTRYKQLLAWAAERGHACVPIAGGDLGLWVAKQRQMKRKGKLSAERTRLLDEAGFTWDTPSADWNEKFSELVRYKERHGDCRVPFNSPDGLGWWVNTQRQARRKGKIAPERQARLDSIGFIWNPQQTARTTALKRRISRIDDRPTSNAPISVDHATAAGPGHTTLSAHSATSAPALGQLGSDASSGGCSGGGVSPASSFHMMQHSGGSSQSHRHHTMSASQPYGSVGGAATAPTTKRHHSFSSADAGSFASGTSVLSAPPTAQNSSGASGSGGGYSGSAWAHDRVTSRRAVSFGVFTPLCPSPSPSPPPNPPHLPQIQVQQMHKTTVHPQPPHSGSSTPTGVGVGGCSGTSYAAAVHHQPSSSADGIFYSGNGHATGSGFAGTGTQRPNSLVMDMSPVTPNSLLPLPVLPPLVFPPSQHHSKRGGPPAPPSPSAGVGASSRGGGRAGDRHTLSFNIDRPVSVGASSAGAGTSAAEPLPSVNTLRVIAQSGSPRRPRRARDFPDARRAVSFPELLDSAFNPAAASSVLGASQPPSPPVSGGSGWSGWGGGGVDAPSGVGLLHPLTDLANLAVSTQGPDMANVTLPPLKGVGERKGGEGRPAASAGPSSIRALLDSDE